MALGSILKIRALHLTLRFRCLHPIGFRPAKRKGDICFRKREKWKILKSICISEVLHAKHCTGYWKMFKNKFVCVREKRNYDFNTKHNSIFQNLWVIEPAVNLPQSIFLRIPRMDLAICHLEKMGGGRAQQMIESVLQHVFVTRLLLHLVHQHLNTTFYCRIIRCALKSEFWGNRTWV